MTVPTFDDCLAEVDQPEAFEPWRSEFDRSLDWADPPVPDGAALVERCRRFRFPDRATVLLVEHRPSFEDPVVRRLAGHHQWTIAHRYHPATYLDLGFPPPPPRCRLAFAYAAVGLAASVADTQRAAGIDPEITAATLWDIGQQVMLYERRHGVADFRQHWWLTHHLGGWLFRIGALQFHLSVPPAALAVGDDWFLDVHIPAGAAFDADSVDRSLAAAPAFFARHFPEHRVRWFGCSSWLLDPALAELLAPDSNIVAFQRRFEVCHVEDDWPSGVFEFVFDRPDLDGTPRPDLDGLPRSTSLERALGDHYAGGGRIRPAVGRLSIAGI